MGLHSVKPSKKLFRALLEYLKGNGGNISDACDKFKISRQTFYNYRDKKGFEFIQEGVIDANKRATENVRSALYKNCLDGNVTAQIYWLNNKSDGEFTNKAYIEHSGSIEEKIANMTPEEKEARLRELEKKKDEFLAEREGKKS